MGKLCACGCAVLLSVFVVQIAGCPRQPIQIPVEFLLGQSLGEFEVLANTATTKTGTGNLGEPPVTIGSGTFEVDPSVITITPSNGSGSKGRVNFQQTSVLVITAWIASEEELDTVCETGEQYGPYEVTLDEDLVPVSVDPSEITLTQNTIDLLNGGTFSLCIELVSPVDGTVTIDSFTFNLGL